MVLSSLRPVISPDWARIRRPQKYSALRLAYLSQSRDDSPTLISVTGRPWSFRCCAMKVADPDRVDIHFASFVLYGSRAASTSPRGSRPAHARKSTFSARVVDTVPSRLRPGPATSRPAQTSPSPSSRSLAWSSQVSENRASSDSCGKLPNTRDSQSGWPGPHSQYFSRHPPARRQVRAWFRSSSSSESFRE